MKIIDNLRTITFIYIRQAIYMHINMTDVKTITQSPIVIGYSNNPCVN